MSRAQLRFASRRVASAPSPAARSTRLEQGRWRAKKDRLGQWAARESAGQPAESLEERDSGLSVRLRGNREHHSMPFSPSVSVSTQRSDPSQRRGVCARSVLLTCLPGVYTVDERLIKISKSMSRIYLKVSFSLCAEC